MFGLAPAPLCEDGWTGLGVGAKRVPAQHLANAVPCAGQLRLRTRRWARGLPHPHIGCLGWLRPSHWGGSFGLGNPL
jgi:hypothetical protein